MVVVIGKRGVDLSEGKVRIGFLNLFHGCAARLALDRHVPDLDAGPRNVGNAAPVQTDVINGSRDHSPRSFLARLAPKPPRTLRMLNSAAIIPWNTLAETAAEAITVPSRGLGDRVGCRSPLPSV